MRFRLDYVLTIVALSSLTAMLAQDQAAPAPKAAAAPKVAAKTAATNTAAAKTAANTTAKAPTASRSAWKQPRTPEGRPDFTGYWSNSTVTPLERPITMKDQETVTPEQKDILETNGNRNDERDNARRAAGAPGAAGVGDYNGQVWYELGKTVLANNRTSIVTDPANGRIPALTPAAAAKQAEDRAYYSVHEADGPEDQDTITRCITWITSGPPMLPTFYNNNYQFVQSKDTLVIVAEMIHDARIIHLDNSPHADASIRQWMGDSRGHWEGDTLVVETTNFNGKRNLLGGRPVTEEPVAAAPVAASADPATAGGRGGGGGGRSGAGRMDEKMKVTERFRRTAQNILLYQFTVDDPVTYTASWSGEIPLRTTDGPLYEYACHEGNYAMVDILSGARAEEKAAPAQQSPQPRRRP
jgi:hypothetical protein